MKKIVSMVAAGVLAFSMLSGLAVSAADISFEKTQRALEVVLDGQKVSFGEVRPIMYKNSTLVPLRVVSENLGAKVKWDGKSQKATIHKDGSIMEMKVNDSTAYVNGEAKEFDSRMVKLGSSVLVPLRFVSEALGANVKFDKDAYYVHITTPDFEQSDAQFDPYGREIRTTNLPKNYKDFPYILKDVPNEMYEMPFHSETWTGIEARTPSDVAKSSYIKRENVDVWKKKIEDYYANVLNIDFTTIDNEWAKRVRKDINMLGGDEEMRDYVKWAKKNKIKAEGHFVAEPSMIYFDGMNFRMRAKFKFKVSYFDKYQSLLFDSRFLAEENINGPLPRYKKNVWYEGYADIAFSSNEEGAQYTPNLKIASDPSLFFTNSIVRESK